MRTPPFMGSTSSIKVIASTKSAHRRTPRSNPATYTGARSPRIRDWFRWIARKPNARLQNRGVSSFNVKGGRCEACQGGGVNQIEMHFLPRRLMSPANVLQRKR